MAHVAQMLTQEPIYKSSSVFCFKPILISAHKLTLLIYDDNSITNLSADLKVLGETIDDVKVVKKFLRVAPARFTSVIVSIEMFCDLKKLTVEELIGRLRAAEERLEEKVEQITDKAGRLLLAEEEWLKKHKHHSRPAPRTAAGAAPATAR